MDLALKALYNSKNHTHLFKVDSFEEVMQKMEQSSKVVIKNLEESNPEFFETFAEDMATGKPFVVEKAYQRAADTISSIIKKIAKDAPESLSALNPHGTCVMVTMVVAEFGVVVMAAALVSVVVIYLDDMNSHDELSRDKMIGHLTATFAKKSVKN